jgi:hypothetical protein
MPLIFQSEEIEQEVPATDGPTCELYSFLCIFGISWRQCYYWLVQGLLLLESLGGRLSIAGFTLCRRWQKHLHIVELLPPKAALARGVQALKEASSISFEAQAVSRKYELLEGYYASCIWVNDGPGRVKVATGFCRDGLQKHLEVGGLVRFQVPQF